KNFVASSLDKRGICGKIVIPAKNYRAELSPFGVLQHHLGVHSMSTTNATTRTTTCTLARAQFAGTAKPVTVAINTHQLSASPKEFSTGSCGWYANGKVQMVVDGMPVQCQVSLSVTVIGSKRVAQGSDESMQAAISTPEGGC